MVVMIVMVVMVREIVRVLLSVPVPPGLVLSSHVTCPLSGSLSLTGRQNERERERHSQICDQRSGNSVECPSACHT